MKRGMEPFLVLNRTICSKSVGYFLTFFFSLLPAYDSPASPHHTSQGDILHIRCFQALQFLLFGRQNLIEN